MTEKINTEQITPETTDPTADNTPAELVFIPLEDLIAGEATTDPTADGEEPAETTDPTAETPTFIDFSEVSVVASGAKKARAKRIGRGERFKAIHGVGAKAKKHNKTLAGKTAEDGSVYGEVSHQRVVNQKRVLRTEMAVLKKERRAILREKLLGRGGSAEVQKRTKKYQERRGQLLDTEAVDKGLQLSGKAVPSRLTAKTARNAAIRNANPQEGDHVVHQVINGQVRSFVIPSRVAERREQLTGRQEIYQTPGTNPDGIPLTPAFETYKDEVYEIITDMRGKITMALDNARRAARADGRTWGTDESNAFRARMLNHLTAGNYYENSGGGVDKLNLRNPETAKIINELLELDKDAFEELFPKPVRKERGRGKRNGDENNDGNGRDSERPRRDDTRQDSRRTSDGDLEILNAKIELMKLQERARLAREASRQPSTPNTPPDPTTEPEVVSPAHHDAIDTTATSDSDVYVVRPKMDDPEFVRLVDDEALTLLDIAIEEAISNAARAKVAKLRATPGKEDVRRLPKNDFRKLTKSTREEFLDDYLDEEGREISSEVRNLVRERLYQVGTARRATEATGEVESEESNEDAEAPDPGLVTQSKPVDDSYQRLLDQFPNA